MYAKCFDFKFQQVICKHENGEEPFSTFSISQQKSASCCFLKITLSNISHIIIEAVREFFHILKIQFQVREIHELFLEYFFLLKFFTPVYIKKILSRQLPCTRCCSFIHKIKKTPLNGERKIIFILQLVSCRDI